jgi:hypothetical protein
MLPSLKAAPGSSARDMVGIKHLTQTGENPSGVHVPERNSFSCREGQTNKALCQDNQVIVLDIFRWPARQSSGVQFIAKLG